MFLYWDPIQTSKMLHIWRTLIDDLKTENTRLKNRPEPTVESKIVIQVSKQKHRLDLDKPVDEWNSAFFVKYFQSKYHEKYDTRPHFRQDEWGAYALRIHDFLRRHTEEINQEEYKQFIDYLFRRVFNKLFIPTIGHITSDTSFYKWYDPKKKKKVRRLDESGIRTFSVEDVDNLLSDIGEK